MATLVIEVDAKEAERALKKLNSSIDSTGQKAEKGFSKGGAALSKFSGGIGTIATGLGGLVTAFAAVSAAGVAAFAAIAAEGVQLASQLENARITFTNIFEGDEGAAEAFLGSLQQQALELGTNFGELTGFAKALLPDTESIDQFERLTKVAVTLEKADPDKTIDDVRVAIEGALSGDFTSLQERFDFNPDGVIANIKDLQGEFGQVEGIIAGLEAEFEKTGTNLEGFTDTFASTQDRIASRFSVLQTQLGEPVLSALTEEFSFFDNLLAENSDTLTLVAQQLGDVAATVVDFIGTGINDFLSDLDFSKFQELATGFFELIERARLIIDLLFQMDEATPNDSIDFLIGLVDKLNRAFETAAQIVALMKAALKALVGDLKNLAVGFEFISSRLNLFKEDLSIEDATAKLVDSNKIFQDSMRESLGTMEESNKRLAENTTRQEERSKAIEADTSAELERAGAILAGKNAMKEQEEAAKAQAEIDEKNAEAAEEREKRLTDIQRKEAQKRFDDEVKNAQKREDIARKNADAIEDILRKQDKAIADEAKDLSREEEDIARDGARERGQIEKDAARARVEVERNFRQQLQDIQRKFNQSAQDAERTNDAQAFLQAVRSRDEQIEVAKSERDVSLEDVGRGAQEQREDLKLQLEQEVEDAKIANARKLEDLNLRLEQELEAQAIKNERDIEQQALQEERQREQRELAAQRTLEDFERSEAEKQEKLEASLEKQFAALEAAKAKEIELTAMAEAEKTKIVEEEMAKRARALAEAEAEAEQTDLPPLPSGIAPPGGITPMAEGGPIAAGQTALVGEGGPEVFTAPQSGFIIPNQTMFSPPGAIPGMAANVNNSRNLSVGQMGINPGDAILSRMVQNELSRFMEILG
jgi:hypothetical protein